MSVSLRMIWFMEEANFIKWMELFSKDCGKIINWFEYFEQKTHSQFFIYFKVFLFNFFFLFYKF